ncbi:MAG: putative toxin-antitoxin system toxin component, PIN family, partial [Candidatus Aureabacteria bacterium]|nr:putative toxin-antitoxin system toxin component, PIN family [Candidatus Auribacterota bacterium]
PFKIVVDTNIFVGAYWNENSASAAILKKIENREVKLLYSRGIEKELFFILKQMKARREFLERVKDILALSREVKAAKKVEVVKDDYSDNKYFACALSGRADCIISSDKHFHSVKNFAIPVLKASEFITSYNV